MLCDVIAFDFVKKYFIYHLFDIKINIYGNLILTDI